jgi:hypothetical protein
MRYQRDLELTDAMSREAERLLDEARYRLRHEADLLDAYLIDPPTTRPGDYMAAAFRDLCASDTIDGRAITWARIADEVHGEGGDHASCREGLIRSLATDLSPAVRIVVRRRLAMLGGVR